MRSPDVRSPEGVEDGDSSIAELTPQQFNARYPLVGEAEVRARGCPVSLRRGVDVVRGGHSLRRRKSARSLADTAPVANWSMTAVTQTMLKARPLPSQQRTQDATAAHDARCRLAMLGELPYVEALAGRRSATTTTR